MTGESAPVEKDPDLILAPDAPLGDWVNMVLSGTLVTAGRARRVVCATGGDSQMGHIGRDASPTRRRAPPPSRPGWRKFLKSCPFCACVCAR